MSDDRIIIVGASPDANLQAKMVAALRDLECQVISEGDLPAQSSTHSFPKWKSSDVFENYRLEPGEKRIRRRKGGSPAERLLEEQRKLRAKGNK